MVNGDSDKIRGCRRSHVDNVQFFRFQSKGGPFDCLEVCGCVCSDIDREVSLVSPTLLLGEGNLRRSRTIDPGVVRGILDFQLFEEDLTDRVGLFIDVGIHPLRETVTNSERRHMKFPRHDMWEIIGREENWSIKGPNTRVGINGRVNIISRVVVDFN